MRSLSHGKSGRAHRKVITVLIIQQWWALWPQLQLPSGSLDSAARCRCTRAQRQQLLGCIRKQSLEVKHQPRSWRFPWTRQAKRDGEALRRASLFFFFWLGKASWKCAPSGAARVAGGSTWEGAGPRRLRVLLGTRIWRWMWVNGTKQVES